MLFFYKLRGDKVEISRWNIEKNFGYKPITTFWEDFSIAEKFGIDAIKNTYNKVFNEFKDNYKYLTELCMVLNRKLWSYYETNQIYGNIYYDLYEKTNSYALDNLKDEEFSYYYDVTN